MNSEVKVKLLKRPISNGMFQSLFLDFYPAIPNPNSGKMTRRFGLSINIWSEPKTKEQRAENKQKEIFAENKRAQIEFCIMKKDYTFWGTSDVKLDLIEQFTAYLQNKNSAFQSTLSQLILFVKERKRMNEIHITFCDNFKTFLKQKLSQNTASLYLDCFHQFLRDAKKKGQLNLDIDELKPIPRIETNRNYLDVNEVKKIMDTECKSDVLKKACLFSIFTGLRLSDIKKMVWTEIQKNENQFVLKYRQQKTKGFEFLPLPQNAVMLLGELKNDNTNVFKFKYDATHRFYLKLWVANAGIKKNITFHCFRHTYATISLNNGIDLYTVSKMLGHRDIRTTQIYAKITDVSKQNAAKKMDSLFCIADSINKN